MSKVRVYEIAKQLNMDGKALVALFQSMGVGDVRNHMSAVESDQVERVKRHLERQQQPDVVEERIRPTVVKRRARVEPKPKPKPKVAAAAPPSAVVASATVAVPPSAEPSRPASAPVGAKASTPVPSPKESAPAAAALSAEPAAEKPPASSLKAPASNKGKASGATASEVAPPSKSEKSEAPAQAAAPSTEAAAASPSAASPSAASPSAASPSAASPSAEPPSSAPPVAAAPPPTAPPVAAAPPPSAPPVAAAPPSAPPVSPATSSEPPRRPSSPPKTGIDVWQGRPGVPMPQPPRTSPPARRTTYDPRASNAPARPGGYGPGRMMGGRMRPGWRRGPPGPKKPVHVSTLEMSSHKKVIKIEEQVTLQQLAGKMSLKSTDVLMRLLSMGMTGVNINSTLDADTAKLLAGEFGWAVEDVAVSEEDGLEAAMGIVAESDEGAVVRPPVVTVMGHVDHGKTSLLDKIRKTTVAAGEAGGITQHIGAYRVETKLGAMTFLDTPGHEAFTSMRARGASVTDIVILVVASDDGVMPQTKEAITHAQNAKVPIIVAVNKMDKPEADIERVKRDLASHGLQSEDWGGETMVLPVSALTGDGIDALLDAVLLQAEVLELKAHPDRKANGVVIEALLDRGRGPVARVLVLDGTLNTGDALLAGAACGKIRAMTDETGRIVTTAGPATPVEVLGLNEVPGAGDPVHSVKDLKTAEEFAATRRKKASKSLIPQDSRMSLETLTSRLAEADTLELKLIIKGDVQGSVEAVVQALSKLTTKKVKVTVVHAGVGAITEGDVNLAVASKAIITGFSVRPAGKAASLADSEGVDIRLYNIIYNAIDDVREAMEALLPATKIEKILGRAEVRQIFRVSKVGVIAGSMVISGDVKRGSQARVLREDAMVHTSRISGLKRFKEDVKTVPEGMECGISLEDYQDLKEGDIVEAYEIEEVKTKLE